MTTLTVPITSTAPFGSTDSMVASPIRPLRQVSEIDAEAFSRLLRDSNNVQENLPISATETAKRDTLGDSILGSLGKLGSEFRSGWNNIAAVSAPQGGESMSFNKALEVQWYMTTLSAQYEMVGKAVSKSAQDIDQLARTQ